MLFLTFQLGTDRYAIEAAHVVEVLPQVHTKEVPNAPAGIVGVLDYHGIPVPVVDLTGIAFGKPSRRQMSTRIVVVNYQGKSGERHMLGLLAERATETLRRNEEDFVDCGLTIASSPYLGPVAMDASGMFQRVEIRSLLSEDVRDALFRERVDVA